MPVSRVKRNTAVVVGLLLVAGIALAVALLSRSDAPVKTEEAQPPRSTIADRLSEAASRRGERPPDGRLHGSKRVESPGEALAMAKDALRRIETELAAAPEEGPERERLLRKKELIEASIERLGR